MLLKSCGPVERLMAVTVISLQERRSTGVVLTREHGEEPRYGVELRHEARLRQVAAQLRVDERRQQTENGQVLLDHGRVVLQEEVVQVLGDERR